MVTPQHPHSQYPRILLQKHASDGPRLLVIDSAGEVDVFFVGVLDAHYVRNTVPRIIRIQFLIHTRPAQLGFRNATVAADRDHHGAEIKFRGVVAVEAYE